MLHRPPHGTASRSKPEPYREPEGPAPQDCVLSIDDVRTDIPISTSMRARGVSKVCLRGRCGCRLAAGQPIADHRERCPEVRMIVLGAKLDHGCAQRLRWR